MKRKYDLVTNLYLDYFEKKENYQNHIRALSTGSSVIEDKQPDPPARIAKRKNRYMEIQKKIYQLGIENSRAISSLSKHNNPKIIEPGSNKYQNCASKIDWLKPYNSTPLPPLNSNQSLFKKNQKNEEKKKTINEDKPKSNDQVKITIDENQNKDYKKQDKSKKVNKKNNNIDDDNNVLYLTEPEAKNSSKISDNQKEGILENTISSISNKMTEEIKNEFEDDFENEDDNKNSNEKGKDDFNNNNINKETFEDDFDDEEKDKEKSNGEFDNLLNNNSNKLLGDSNKNEKDVFDDAEIGKEQFETDDFKIKDDKNDEFDNFDIE